MGRSNIDPQIYRASFGNLLCAPEALVYLTRLWYSCTLYSKISLYSHLLPSLYTCLAPDPEPRKGFSEWQQNVGVLKVYFLCLYLWLSAVLVSPISALSRGRVMHSVPECWVLMVRWLGLDFPSSNRWLCFLTYTLLIKLNFLSFEENLSFITFPF